MFNDWLWNLCLCVFFPSCDGAPLLDDDFSGRLLIYICLKTSIQGWQHLLILFTSTPEEEIFPNALSLHVALLYISSSNMNHK